MVDPSLKIKEFEPSDQAYADLAVLHNAVWVEDRATASWLRRVDRERPADRPIHRVTAVGETGLWLGMVETGPARWSDDPRRYEMSVLVHPEFRRRGVGGRLWNHAMSRIRARADAVEGATTEDRVASVAFLEARGCRCLAREPQSELDVASFDASRWRDRTARLAADGVTLEALGHTAEDREPLLRPIWKVFRECLPDIPGRAEEVALPFDVWRRSFDANPDFVPEMHIIARTGGRVVGITQLWASQGDPSVLYTGFTGVARDHRQRGIATALKVRSIRAAQQTIGAVKGGLRIKTNNEESNPMLSINRALGFVEVSVRLIFERRVEL
jgi:GNAT superfamily N-acetyltransferase